MFTQKNMEVEYHKSSPTVEDNWFSILCFTLAISRAYYFDHLGSFKTCNSFWKKNQNNFAKNIQCLYNYANNWHLSRNLIIYWCLLSVKLNRGIEGGLEIDSLDLIKKKLDKFYVITILCTMNLDFDHARDQILILQELFKKFFLWKT